MPLESPTKVFGCVHRIGGSIHRASGPDFTLTVPEGLPFGLYAVRLVADNDVDYVPFYVKAEVGNEKKICFLAPTASYMAYANDHVNLSAPLAQLFAARTPVVEQNNIVLSVHREFGLSTYDQHTDGSGVAYSTRQRPILNMRPGFRHWLSPSLWQFNADLHRRPASRAQ
ncbi:N,N-dimethylformamidase beta subunit family domain-containing protein [Nocardia salmonicida]|uniref:N,N-dimethylformamidase beta subunit family domain-containing protein n=1 Tax=Nocardia salmonicida TaxID=53431 RepID=UPI003CF89281